MGQNLFLPQALERNHVSALSTKTQPWICIILVKNEFLFPVSKYQHICPPGMFTGLIRTVKFTWKCFNLGKKREEGVV